MEFKMNLKKNFINKITNKYIDNKELTITGKILHYIQDIDIFSFFCTVNKSTSLNPFSSDIYFNFEFKDTFRHDSVMPCAGRPCTGC